jgi:hypothetical protein
MEKQQIIKYVKIGLLIAGGIFAVKFIRKQIKLRKLKGQFGDYNTLIDNNKGNVGGVSLPQDTNIQWSPRSSAEALRDAMKGLGTDEETIWATLEPLSKDQRAKVRNYFNTYFANGQNLFQWFASDLGSSDLAKAKSYFN